MSETPLFAGPHRRYNPLTGEWVLVSAQRTKRPWMGQTEHAAQAAKPAFDPECYLCPGNGRAGGAVNPAYESTFVFDNDYPALTPQPNPHVSADDPLFKAAEVSGTCRVICFSPRHDLTLGQMDPEDIRKVIALWAEQTDLLFANHAWVQVFENKGEAMGASNPHPHGQIWAGSELPTYVEREGVMQERYLTEHGSSLLVDYARAESGGPRVVVENRTWIAIVPYWATWPFEMLFIPKSPVGRLSRLDERQSSDLAVGLKELLTRYDNLFEHPFPYSMGWHPAPVAGAGHWQLHAHFYPPLLRSATIRKFMVGYELLAEAQRDIYPEDAAKRLRAVPAVHYSTR